MRRTNGLSLLLVLLFAAGILLAQTGAAPPTAAQPGTSFTLETEIGRALPRNLLYNAPKDQLLVVSAYGAMTLVDARTYETQFTLYENGAYNDYAFSHDGSILALAIDQRIELWDTATGTLTTQLDDLSEPIQIQGPLAFSDDDQLLVFYGLYPAPRSIRRFEGDTSIVPWVWNLNVALNDAAPTYPSGRVAWQFFDYRSGFVLGPGHRVIAALPGRVQIIDGMTLETLFEIPTDRYEQDPLTVYLSQRDNHVYVQPVNQSALLQIDPMTGAVIEVPLNIGLTSAEIAQLGGIETAEGTRVIGQPNSRTSTPLLRTLLDPYYGQDYREAFDNRPLTITLIDVVLPPAATDDLLSVLFLVFDEGEQTGRFILSRPRTVQQMLPNAAEDILLVRQTVSDRGEFIIGYDFNTGRRLLEIVPALRDLGSYSRFRKNRVLAYAPGEAAIISDFQRLDPTTGDVIAEDLRYSRRFEQFFFTEDSRFVVTLSGTEWRLWSLETNEVVRREVLRLEGNIVSTADDGSRFLTYFLTSGGGEGAQVTDLYVEGQAAIEQRSVEFTGLPGRFIEAIYPSPNWERFFVVYGQNPYGQYAPGNEVALYEMGRGMLWFMAGDDLPPADLREYGWVDNQTVYVIGEGIPSGQPARVFGVEADASGLPACVVEAFPEQFTTYADLWERLTVSLRPDKLANLSLLICADLPNSPEEAQQLLLPTNTPPPVTLTPIRIDGVPVCLTARYPSQAEEYAQIWRETTAGLSPDQQQEIEVLLCEGIGEFNLGLFTREESQRVTMLIDAASGVRSSGSFVPIPQDSRPIDPIQREFERTEERSLGTAILSPNEQLVAASSLPGELLIYRMITSYRSLLAVETQRAGSLLAQRNLIGVLPSPTPTYNAIGTPRPTLTPTITPTPLPRPEVRVPQSQFGEVQDVCPSETLYTLDTPPQGYAPTGRIVGDVLGDFLWRAEPETGQRVSDETIPQCGSGLDCQFSPDRQWILASTINEIFVVRPDGSDLRTLFAFTEDGLVDEEVNPLPEDQAYVSIPPAFYWSGNNTLEVDVDLALQDSRGYTYYVYAIRRDILGVFPDPAPYIPEQAVNEIQARLENRQPGGPLAVVTTSFSTGIQAGSKYYIYNTETGAYSYFARVADEPGLSFEWHPQGDRLFYAYYTPSSEPVVWYQYTAADDTHYLLENLPSGEWSQDGRYAAAPSPRQQRSITVWDSHTGLTRRYCLPETEAAPYQGPIRWSPDSRYLALLTYLPKDRNVEGIGQHLLVLDIETGAVVDLTTGFTTLVDWSREPGTYGGAQ